MAKRSIVGDVINFRGLVYAPVNEMAIRLDEYEYKIRPLK